MRRDGMYGGAASTPTRRPVSSCEESRGGRGPAKRLLPGRPVVLLLGVLLMASGACAGGDDSEAAGDGGGACEFDGSTDVPRVEPVGGPFRISEVRHEIVQPGCEERLVFIFESLPDDAEPGYEVRYRDTPFRGPAGEIEVGGDALLEIVLFEAGGGAEPSRAADAELVVDIVKPPEVPGGSLWLMGLEQERPFTVGVERTPEPALIVAIGASGDS